MQSTAQEIFDYFSKHKLTLSFAESCTGGLASAELVELPGISSIYLGSVVSYSDSMKKQILGVQAGTLQAHGAVSEEVALEMARGVQKVSGSHWAGAITGIAGPSGGSPDKPVGTVCFAVVGPNFVGETTQHFQGSRRKIQEESVKFLFGFLLQACFKKS